MFGEKEIKKPKQEDSECEIKVKRNREGKIVGMTRKGKCTKEDVEIFKRNNGIDVEE